MAGVTEWYYLIHLGYDIVQCPGEWDTASEHLKQLRLWHIEWSRLTTGHNPDKVPWLIGVYRPYTEWEKLIMPKTYGYTATLMGSIDKPFVGWERVGDRMG